MAYVGRHNMSSLPTALPCLLSGRRELSHKSEMYADRVVFTRDVNA